MKQNIKGFKAAFSASGNTNDVPSEPGNGGVRYYTLGSSRCRFHPARFHTHAVKPQVIIDIKSIAVVALGLGHFIDRFLNGFLGSLPNHSKVQVAVGEAFYDTDDIDLIYSRK